MTGFKVTTQHGQEIKSEFYLDDAAITSSAMQSILPFTRIVSKISINQNNE
jgi:hypothetical protein